MGFGGDEAVGLEDGAAGDLALEVGELEAGVGGGEAEVGEAGDGGGAGEAEDEAEGDEGEKHAAGETARQRGARGPGRLPAGGAFPFAGPAGTDGGGGRAVEAGDGGQVRVVGDGARGDAPAVVAAHARCLLPSLEIKEYSPRMTQRTQRRCEEVNLRATGRRACAGTAVRSVSPENSL